MRPGICLSISTGGRFLWLKTLFGRPEPARELFNSLFFALAESLGKRMHPLESRDTSFSVYFDGRSPLGAYASPLTLPLPYGVWYLGRDSLLPHSCHGVAVRVGSPLHIVPRGYRPLLSRDLLRFAAVPRHLDRAL